MRVGDCHPFKNMLLADLREEDQVALQALMHQQVFVTEQILHDFNAPVADVYFLEAGMAATVCQLEAGRQIEVVATGIEGMIGGSVLFGAKGIMSPRSFVQMPGHGWRMRVEDFLSACRRMPAFYDRCMRFLHVILAQTVRSVACNAVHGMEARFASWLLTAEDRVRTGVLALTHEDLAVMVGGHRTRITAMARRWQDAGCIRYSRGRLIITGRAEL